MPEGDTIHRAAASLRRALGDGPVIRFDAPRAPGPRPEPGERIGAVEARGKHLLIGFEGGATLHTHLGMRGSWRVLPADAEVRVHERGQPGRGTVALIATERATAVCRDAPTVELLDAAGLRRHPVLRTLGPDLCDASPDLDEVIRRLQAVSDPTREIGVVLLDQRIASGIGNVYRSEVLWACEVDPFAPLRSLGPRTRRLVYATAHRQLRANLTTLRRSTVPAGLAVYERNGRACRRCGGTIQVARLGEQARTTWWCPECQTLPGTAEGEARSG